MKKVLVLLLIIPFCKGPRDLSIHYPAPPPEDSIVSFLPGIVSSGADSIDFNAAFSPDGQSFYFTRSVNRKWTIYVSHYDGKQWTKAIRAGFNDTVYSMADPAFGPDGYLYFISDLPRTASDTLRDFDIWFVKPLADGRWSAPENLLAVNTDSTEYYVSFSPGGHLYFASSRTGGYGLEDLYISKLVEGKYSQPENLGPKINTPYSDHDPCLSQQEDFMIYTSVDRKEGLGEGDLYLARKDANGQWSEVRSMGTLFNTSTYEYCSYFSPDFKYFFFSSRRDVKWMRTASLLKIVQ
ncbi:TolB-like translocation protein [Chitinophaga niabensis]|uniref:WD40-like Beta Propeller Repeat n=1 Tax=Chitinophaga niabensis TaxID=536979 RepID=A0A1N6K2Z5_9BACT|nr:PD40 domain-containing protein [Chitinophaga niabensis]SIO50958.1 WD40-like Beta Propeller Repeat [Chitinophaga niabensis]